MLLLDDYILFKSKQEMNEGIACLKEHGYQNVGQRKAEEYKLNVLMVRGDWVFEVNVTIMAAKGGRDTISWEQWLSMVNG